MSATPLVLLHPFPVDARFWEPLQAAGLGDREVLCPEAPGFGAAPARDGWAIADWAAEVAGLIRASAPGGRAAVAGASMGGYCALALVAAHPEVVEGLVLMDTRAEPDDEPTRTGRMDTAARIGREGLGPVLDALLPRLVAPGADEEVRARLRRLAEGQRPETVIGALRALAGRPDRRPVLPSIAVPTLVVVGAHDVPTPPEVARAMADGIAGARLAVVDGAGHMSPLEDPAAVAALVRTHLAALPGG
jgi:pimeloyl-ACP methyl ester carboxylesterase